MEKKNLVQMQTGIGFKNVSPYSPKQKSHLKTGVSKNFSLEGNTLNTLMKAQELHKPNQETKKNVNAQMNKDHNIGNLKTMSTLKSPVEQLQAVHAKVTSIRTKNEEAISDLKARIPEIENIFDIHNRIGNGTFSTVLLATLKKDRDLADQSRRKFAIKHHIPTSHPDRIMKELECMAKLGGKDNVVGINCCLRYNESVAFIMPYLAHDRFQDFFQKMDVCEVQFYMKNLLIALRHVHSFNVIHRDVKPTNFLYNRKKKQFLLVDFGLAQQVPQRLIEQNKNANQNTENTANNNNNNNNNNNYNDLSEKNPLKRMREEESGNIKDDTLNAVNDKGTSKRLKLIDNKNDDNNATFKIPLQQNNANANTNNNEDVVACPESTGLIANAEHNNNNESTGNAQRESTTGRVAGGACNLPLSSSNQSTLQTNPTSTNNSNNNNNNNNNNSQKSKQGPNNNEIVNKYNTNRNSNQNTKCHCYGSPQVCNICLVKKEVHASRAGTPGYRPPEVLLKYPDQTTAVDIWAAGVILLSMLSSVYPFFKAPNDYMALAEMVTIFGDKRIRKTAFVLDRLVTLSQKSKPLDLRKLCVRFRNRNKFSSQEMLKKHQKIDGTCEVCQNCDQYFYNCLCIDTNYKVEPFDADDLFPASAYDLLNQLLEVNPLKRITAEDALKHPFITETYYTHGSSAIRLPSLPKKIGSRHENNLK